MSTQWRVQHRINHSNHYNHYNHYTHDNHNNDGDLPSRNPGTTVCSLLSQHAVNVCLVSRNLPQLSTPVLVVRGAPREWRLARPVQREFSGPSSCREVQSAQQMAIAVEQYATPRDVNTEISSHNSNRLSAVLPVHRGIAQRTVEHARDGD